MCANKVIKCPLKYSIQRGKNSSARPNLKGKATELLTLILKKWLTLRHSRTLWYFFPIKIEHSSIIIIMSISGHQGFIYLYHLHFTWCYILLFQKVSSAHSMSSSQSENSMPTTPTTYPTDTGGLRYRGAHTQAYPPFNMYQ